MTLSIRGGRIKSESFVTKQKTKNTLNAFTGGNFLSSWINGNQEKEKRKKKLIGPFVTVTDCHCFPNEFVSRLSFIEVYFVV